MPVGYLLGPTVDFMVSLVVIHLLGGAIVLFLFHVSVYPQRNLHFNIIFVFSAGLSRDTSAFTLLYLPPPHYFIDLLILTGGIVSLNPRK